MGRRGNRQDITLGAGCTVGNCIHEIGHAVGLWHEQSREDRDAFLRALADERPNEALIDIFELHAQVTELTPEHA